MKPQTIPFVLLVAVVVSMAIFTWLIYGDENTNTNEADVAEPESVDEGVIETGYNFLTEPISVPSPVTPIDAPGVTMTASELETFYTNMNDNYLSLDYGGYLGEGIEEPIGDTDIISSMIVSDLTMLALENLDTSAYQPPILSDQALSEYSDTTVVTFPPTYVMEVMARDIFFAMIDPEYVTPDRSAYYTEGVAAGLYYQEDIAVAEEFVNAYYEAISDSATFNALISSPRMISEPE